MKKSLLLFFYLSCTCIGISQNLENGLVLYFPFSGDTSDHSIYNHSSAVNGTPELINNLDDEEGEAIQFVGQEFIEVEGHESFVIDSTITISVWVKATGLENIFLHKMENETTGSSYSLDNYNGYPRFFLNKSLDDYGVTSTDALVNDEWIHVLGTYDGTTMNLYINGELDVTRDFTTTIATTEVGNIGIGRYLAGNSEVDASYDEIRLYDRVLSSPEIQELSNSVTITSLGIFQIEGKVSLYPNPVNTGDDISIDLPYDLQPDAISIFDSNGRFVKIIEDRKKISTADLPKGLYEVIITSKGKNYSSRLILN